MAATQAQSAEELQRQIEALQAQIQSMNPAKQAQQEEEEYEEYTEEYEEEIIEEETIEESVEEEVVEEAPSVPSGFSSKPLFRRNKQPAASTPSSSTPTKSAPPASTTRNTQPRQEVPPESLVSNRKQMDSLKQKYSFERPGWAAPVEVTNSEKEIDADSINNPFLKKAQGGGYQRQVKEKNDLAIVKGTFVKSKTHEQPKVQPRLAWIVVNVNKRKVGKIVMHLHGKDVKDLVDSFVELKGYALTRENGLLMTVDKTPCLAVTSAGPKGLDDKAGVFGVIQEGQDIFQQAMAADANATLSIKQAHIYPVKQGKREFGWT